VSQSILEQSLIEVEPLNRTALQGSRVFFHDFSQERPTLVLLLHKAKDLVYLIGNNVSVFVDLVAKR